MILYETQLKANSSTIKINTEYVISSSITFNITYHFKKYGVNIPTKY